MAAGTIWICQPSCTNHVLHILRDVGAEVKVSVLRPTYLRSDKGLVFFDRFCSAHQRLNRQEACVPAHLEICTKNSGVGLEYLKLSIC